MTTEGYQFTPGAGLQAGLPCDGAIERQVFFQSPDNAFDVIVIGAGFAGLTAVRELSVSGLKVLLLEGRDRIGGRTWTSIIDQHPYEMGGTWVHWSQPHIYSEITRYDMGRELKSSFEGAGGANHFNANVDGEHHRLTAEAEYEMSSRTWELFFDVDGKSGRDVIPFPHDPFRNLEMASKYDALSVQDRIAEIKDRLSPLERTCLESLALHYTGGNLNNMGFFDLLRWWALCDHNYNSFINYCVNYKFKHGQTSFALKFLEEAIATGNLSYHFGWKVNSIRDLGHEVRVTSRTRAMFHGKRCVSTVPLNVLKEISFFPPLISEKQEAISIGHIGQASKVHVEAAESDLGTLTAIVYPNNPLVFAWGNGTTPAGTSNIVMFGSDETYLDPEADVDRTIAAATAFQPMNIKRLVFHNWSKDEFAKGTWCMLAPTVATKYISHLRERHGNIFFSSSDWALGWRGFVEGAIEEGKRASVMVRKDLMSGPSRAKTFLGSS